MVYSYKKLVFMCFVGLIGSGWAMEPEGADQESRQFISLAAIIRGSWRPARVADVSATVLRPMVMRLGQPQTGDPVDQPIRQMRPRPLVAVIDQVPYHVVDAKRLSELVELLSHTLCINDYKRNGDTALHIACKNIDLSQALILVRAILANTNFSLINVKNREGETALQLVMKRFDDCASRSDSVRCHTLLQVLREHGAHFEFDGLEAFVLSRQLGSIELVSGAPRAKKAR